MIRRPPWHKGCARHGNSSLITPVGAPRLRAGRSLECRAVADADVERRSRLQLAERQICFSDQSPGEPGPDAYPRLRSRMLSSAFQGITPVGQNQPPSPADRAALLGNIQRQADVGMGSSIIAMGTAG
jgi:hypothetical protein